MVDNNTSYSEKSIAYIGVEIIDKQAKHSVSTKAVFRLVYCVEGTNRNITTGNYYTSLILAIELKLVILLW